MGKGEEEEVAFASLGNFFFPFLLFFPFLFFLDFFSFLVGELILGFSFRENRNWINASLQLQEFKYEWEARPQGFQIPQKSMLLGPDAADSDFKRGFVFNGEIDVNKYCTKG